MSSRKAPTAWFWVVLLLTVAASYPWPDELIGYAGKWVFGCGLAVALTGALTLQVTSRGDDPWRYWMAMLVVSVAGTEAADGMHAVVRVPYLAALAVCLAALAVIVAAWQRAGRTLPPANSGVRWQEGFWWAAAFAAFAGGAALVHAAGAVLAPLRAPMMAAAWATVAGVIVVARRYALLGRRRARLAPAAAFWALFIVMRPLGTAVGYSLAGRGLGMNRWLASVILAVLGIALIGARRPSVTMAGPAE